MIPFMLALVSIPITKSLSIIFYLPFLKIERLIQWQGKSVEEWRDLGIDSPGERLLAVSFISGVIGTTISATAAILAAALIFRVFHRSMPFGFLIVTGFLMVFHDVGRVRRFHACAYRWTEIGYLVGDVIGMMIGALLAFSLGAEGGKL
jgi:hypothetical protein